MESVVRIMKSFILVSLLTSYNIIMWWQIPHRTIKYCFWDFSDNDISDFCFSYNNRIPDYKSVISRLKTVNRENHRVVTVIIQNKCPHCRTALQVCGTQYLVVLFYLFSNILELKISAPGSNRKSQYNLLMP